MSNFLINNKFVGRRRHLVSVYRNATLSYSKLKMLTYTIMTVFVFQKVYPKVYITKSPGRWRFLPVPEVSGDLTWRRQKLSVRCVNSMLLHRSVLARLTSDGH